MFNEILAYLKADRKSVRSMLIYVVASSVLVLTIPFLIQTLIQQYTLLIFQQSTLFLIITVSLFLVGITVMRVLQMHLSEYLQRRLFLKAIKDTQDYAKRAKANNKRMSKKKWNFVFDLFHSKKA